MSDRLHNPWPEQRIVCSLPGDINRPLMAGEARSLMKRGASLGDAADRLGMRPRDLDLLLWCELGWRGYTR